MALILIVLLLPVLAVLSLAVVVLDGWPFWFLQERVGKNGKVFKIFKFRTMVKGAEKLQKKYEGLNEANGPVFKIHNDPRLTRVGKFLYHTGLDELPQLFNVLKGEMSLVGPRPLPLIEERQIPREYRKKRRQVRPGIISTWIMNGYHQMKFEDWMKCDIEYIEKKNTFYDAKLLLKAIFFVMKLVETEIV